MLQVQYARVPQDWHDGLLLHSHILSDIHLLPKDDSEEVKKKKEETENKLGGLDQRFNERFMEKMRVMQGAGRSMADISITIYQRGDTAVFAREWKLARPQSSRQRKELETPEGTIDYTTSERDAPVEICVQSMAASSTNPSRVSLIVTQQVKRKQKQQDNPEIQQHVSRIEEELGRLDRKVDMILMNADYAKEQEADFHELSLAMNRASQYWPILHIVVLLVTGFTQANHIIRFFKSRHIY